MTIKNFSNWISIAEASNAQGIMKGVRKSSGPWTIVAFDNKNKLLDQSTTNVATAVPAHVAEIKDENRKAAHCAVEDSSGKVVWTSK